MSGSDSQNQHEAQGYNEGVNSVTESVDLTMSVGDFLVVDLVSSRDSDAGQGVRGAAETQADVTVDQGDIARTRSLVQSRTIGGVRTSGDLNELHTEREGDSGREADEVEMFEAGVEDRVVAETGSSNPSTSGRPEGVEEEEEDGEEEGDEEEEEGEEGSPVARPPRRTGRRIA